MFTRLPITILLALMMTTGLLPLFLFGTDPSAESLLAPAAHAQSRARNLIARLRGKAMPDSIVKSNGRIEATQVDVSAKYPGRLAEVTVNEGDEVTAGQVVGRISSPEYEAQLRGAQAQVLKAKQALAEAEALIVQRNSDLTFAKSDFERGQELVKKGYLSKQAFDQRRNTLDAADAASRVAMAQRDQAEFAIKTADFDVERIEAILVELTLLAPRSGRVQYLLARTGEVVGAGARILTILDLQDVYMTMFLPAANAGKLELGDEARIILDPVPQYVIPASVSFVAADAQFTPKSVETSDEREKLMFRVKLQVDPKVLQRFYRRVKTGVRGMGVVRTSTTATWPDDLVTKLPQ